MPSAYAPLVGGVEELTRHLARQLRQRGHEVEVWTPLVEGLAPTEMVEGAMVRRFNMYLPPARVGAVLRLPVEGLRCLARLMAAVRRFRPDVLHVQCFSVNGAYAAAAATLAGVPLVVTLQGETMMDDHDIFEHSSGLRGALRFALRRARAVTACSQFVLDDAVARFGLAPGRGEVVFNGVDLEEPAVQSLEVPFDRFVLALGRMVKKKGFDLLLEAFPALIERVPGVGLVLGGAGSYQPALEARARELDLQDSVHFPGNLDRGQVVATMQRADAFVMPSRLEPFGIVVLEAWRAGCPVIASSIGGAPEFVRDGNDGVLVDPRDRGALEQALTRMLTDPALRRKLAAGGTERVREFEWKLIAQRYLDVYGWVTSPRGHTGKARTS